MQKGTGEYTPVLAAHTPVFETPQLVRAFDDLQAAVLPRCLVDGDPTRGKVGPKCATVVPVAIILAARQVGPREAGLSAAIRSEVASTT
eukprot:COSAG01_NODE_18661_length_1061_cov_1.691268_2_plen_88_part_01